MNTMGKGEIWINGNSIGRHWPGNKAFGACQQCSYAGFFYENKCLYGCGQPSQRWWVYLQLSICSHHICTWYESIDWGFSCIYSGIMFHAHGCIQKGTCWLFLKNGVVIQVVSLWSKEQCESSFCLCKKLQLVVIFNSIEKLQDDQSFNQFQFSVVWWVTRHLEYVLSNCYQIRIMFMSRL